MPFVAVRVGRSYDVREVLGLADDLKISRAEALGYLVLWEELILEVGDALSGRVKGYTPKHLAAKLGFRGRPARLVDALKRAGVLGVHKGTFLYPDWRNTITGDYAYRKATDRETWRRQKAAQKEAARLATLGSNGADVQIDSTWNGHGTPPALHLENSQKERKDSAGLTPQAPAPSAGELASRRWEWLKNHHKRPVNVRGCTEILGAMTEEDWRLVQWAWTPESEGGGLNSLSRTRIMRADSYKFLRREAYLEIRPRYLAKLAPPAAPKNGKAKPDASEEYTLEARRARAVRNVLACLADADATDAQKDKQKRIFADLWGPPLPWEDLTADPGQN